MTASRRILHLVEDPALLRAQLDGQPLPPGDHRYTYGLSTDAIISGRACTLGYAPDVLGPHLLEDLGEVVGAGDIAASPFDVIRAGPAYGSGSSREVAVVAHQGAGIKLIIAPSFQRIFQENLVYCGLPHTTRVDIAGEIEAGGTFDAQALADDLPPFFRDVATSGGLLPYAHALASGHVEAPSTAASGPCNEVERLIAQRVWRGEGQSLGVPAVQPGDQVLVRVGFRGLHEYTAGMVMSLYARAFGDAPLFAPDAVAAFEDHFNLLHRPDVPASVRNARLGPAQQLTAELRDVATRFALPVHGRDLPGGVCHRVVVERYASPGDVVILTDSHAPTAGVLGAFAFGVGSTAMAFALRTGLVPVTVPKVLRVEVTGEPSGGLSPKDLILHLIGHPWLREERWRTHPADTCVALFDGPGLDHWSVDELSVLTNMTVEGGLMTGMVAPRPPVLLWLDEHRPPGAAAGYAAPDEGARYAHTLRIDLADVPLTVAAPGDSRQRTALASVGHVPIHNVVIASCTGASLADLHAAAGVLRHRRIAPSVRLTVTPASDTVLRDADADGTLAVLREAGATVTEPGCGACIGNGPGIPAAGETTVSTTNRNFDRRMGAPGPVWLASPAVAAASAVAGALVDPRTLKSA